MPEVEVSISSSKWEGRVAVAQLILLGEVRAGRLNWERMDSLPPFLDSLGEYPRWFVVACVTLVAAVGLWMLARALKWTLYLLVAVIVIAGGSAVVWYLMQ